MSVVAARMCAVVSVAGEAKVAGDAFGGELDRRERVLDLVRHAARDFAPCGRTLGGEQLGQVFDDEDDAARRRCRWAERGRGQGDGQACAVRVRGARQFKLPCSATSATCTLQDAFKQCAVFARHDLCERCAGRGRLRQTQHQQRGCVDRRDAVLFVERDDAG